MHGGSKTTVSALPAGIPCSGSKPVADFNKNLTLNPSHGVEVRTAKANANAKAVRQTPNTKWQM